MYELLPAILIVMMSFIFTGIVIRVKSIITGRKGPGLLQPVKDMARNFRKGEVYGTSSGIIFRIAPSVSLASTIIAMMFVPIGTMPGLFSFQGDFIFFAYTLAVGKFFMVIAAIDTGSSFEGMGASREALFSLIVEPAFFIIIGSLAFFTRNLSFADIFLRFNESVTLTPLPGYSAAAGCAILFALIGMIENSRMPIDDPKTHLELTMIHEVMILDYSGFDLGIIMYNSALKLAMYGSLISNFFISPFHSVYGAIFIFIISQFLYAVFIGITETFMARLRMKHNPQFILIVSALALLIFFGVQLMHGKT